MNNAITAGRLSSLLRCARAHFWGHEIGLRDTTRPALPLRFGTCWANAMEARWKGATFKEALAVALPEGVDLDPYEAEKVSAMLAAYYELYGEIETMIQTHPEVEFSNPIPGTNFVARGKIDGLGTDRDGMSAIVENKTTSSQLHEGSDYWTRLRFNVQVLQYVTEARNMGWDISRVYYDVARKPQLKPKEIAERDELGRKIVIDKNGERVWNKPKKDGTVEPRQSGSESEGFTLKTRVETPQEYGDRVYASIKERPENYFTRREVPVIDEEVEDYQTQRIVLISVIEHLRSLEGETRNPKAWPRAVGDGCKFCSYAKFCLQNISVDPNNPPPGYVTGRFNVELSENQEEGESEDESQSAS